MKKEKTILLGGLILVLALGIYVVTWAALDVGTDLNMTPLGKGPFEILKLKIPSAFDSAATWGYVKDAVNGNDPDGTGNVGIWRQNASYDVYLNDGTLPSFALSGNVGIGTNDPQYLLDLQGTGIQNLRLRSTSTTGVEGAGIYLGDATDKGDGWHISSVGEGGDKPLDFAFCDDLSCLTWNIRFTYDGKVGIGTPEPQEKLHVAGDAWVNNDLLVGGFIGVTECGGPDAKGIRIGDDSYIYDDSCAVDWPPAGQYPENITEQTLHISSGDDIAIKSGGDGKTGTNYGIYIDTDGRVSVGTDTVGSAGLTIANNALVPPNKKEGLMLFKPSTGDSVHLYIDNSANFNFDRTGAGGVDDTTRLIMDTDGDVGIGVSPGSYKLNVASDSGNNPVLIGDDLTVGGTTETDDLHVIDDAQIYGNLFCQSTASIGLSEVPANLSVTGNIFVGDDGTGTCDAGYVGKMRYYTYEEATYYYAEFQICMQTDTSSYSWYTINQEVWGGQSS